MTMFDDDFFGSDADYEMAALTAAADAAERSRKAGKCPHTITENGQSGQRKCSDCARVLPADHCPGDRRYWGSKSPISDAEIRSMRTAANSDRWSAPRD
jgi:hypothetical protein